MIESHGIIIIRINPDDVNFNMHRLIINQIYTHNIKSTEKNPEKSTKKSLIDDL